MGDPLPYRTILRNDGTEKCEKSQWLIYRYFSVDWNGMAAFGLAASLLGFQRIGTVPVLGRRRDLKRADAFGIDIIERLESVLLVGGETLFDGGERARPVAAPVARQHVHVQ